MYTDAQDTLGYMFMRKRYTWTCMQLTQLQYGKTESPALPSIYFSMNITGPRILPSFPTLTHLFFFFFMMGLHLQTVFTHTPHFIWDSLKINFIKSLCSIYKHSRPIFKIIYAINLFQLILKFPRGSYFGFWKLPLASSKVLM